MNNFSRLVAAILSLSTSTLLVWLLHAAITNPNVRSTSFTFGQSGLTFNVTKEALKQAGEAAKD